MKVRGIGIALEPGIQRRSLWVALFAGRDVMLWKVALTYCVPCCVATYGAVSARLGAGR